MTEIQRVSFYIDGYNFYCGVRAKYGKKWLWLDLGGVCRSILRPNQRLEAIHYCTAPVRGDSSKLTRQEDYWKALRTVPGLEIHLGYHQTIRKRCFGCKAKISKYEEKQTDSRIAALMVADAMADRADLLALIAGDSDHIPPIEIIRQECPDKSLLVCWPPERKSDALAKAVGSHMSISERLLRKNQFPDQVKLPNGSTVTRPAHWSK